MRAGHSLLVRLTHWTRASAVLALIGTGWLILLAHPRLYWGEDGYFGDPAWLDLPLEVNEDHIAWGRSLHFLAAWVLVANGAIYALAWLFGRRLAPDYGLTQRLTYQVVLFVVLPVMVLSGLAMSPAVTAAWPGLFTLFGGRQSARSVHFLGTALLAAFSLGHIALALRGGLRGMVTGVTETGR